MTVKRDILLSLDGFLKAKKSSIKYSGKRELAKNCGSADKPFMRGKPNTALVQLAQRTPKVSFEKVLKINCITAISPNPIPAYGI